MERRHNTKADSASVRVGLGGSLLCGGSGSCLGLSLGLIWIYRHGARRIGSRRALAGVEHLLHGLAHLHLLRGRAVFNRQ